MNQLTLPHTPAPPQRAQLMPSLVELQPRLQRELEEGALLGQEELTARLLGLNDHISQTARQSGWRRGVVRSIEG